jgi:molecular chaperone GrpE
MNEKDTEPKDESETNEEIHAFEEEIRDLRRELDSVREEKDKLFDRLQRVYADYANFQKRVPKNIADSVAYEKERFIRLFLPVLDNLEHTLKAHAAESKDPLVRGVEITYGQMLDILKSQGITQIQAAGEKFDPERHQAMLRRSEPDKEDDAILEEVQKGYTMNGRVLRPSRVVVNKLSAPAGAEAPSAPAPEESPENASAAGTDAGQADAEQESNTE